MKLRSMWICVVWGTTVAACSFDRTPVAHRDFSEADRFWASELDQESTARRGAQRAAAAAIASDKSKAKTTTNTRGSAPNMGSRGKPGDEDAGLEEDAGPAMEPKPPSPVACGDQFCPLSEAPVTTCCTTQSDIEQWSARAVGACGVDLSALDEAQYGQGCWQRDQLGIIDPRCPGRGSELGCCADDGMCGSSDPGNHLGCYHAKDAELRPCRQETAPVANMCDPRGSYALRVNVDAAWNGRPGGLAALTDDGRGLIQIYLLVRVDDYDVATGGLTTAARVCGVSLPQFYSTTLCESYLANFPASIWESPALPVPSLAGKYECDADGCVMSMWPTTYLFGMRLDNPEAPWPTAQQTPYLRCPNLPDENCFADDDLDGQPGITLQMQTEGSPAVIGTCRSYPYRAAPLSDSIAAIFGGVRRADRLNVGIRARVGGSVRFGADCGSASGSAVVEYVNSRAQGCHVQPGTFDLVTNTGPAGPEEPCRADEASFIDLSMPVYQVLGAGEAPAMWRGPRDTTPSDGPTVNIVRFAPGTVAGCADARNAPF